MKTNAFAQARFEPNPFRQAIRQRRVGLGIGMGGLLLAIGGSAHAQTDSVEVAAAQTDATAIPEVVVTAERREGTLQSTPVAVNVISADEIESRGFRTLNDLAGLAAGLHAPTSSTASTEPFFIRGIGTSRANGNPSVGVYIDDVYIARPFGVSYMGSMPDIERLEILHGPQGTLYGQNTSAGAIKLISKTPTDTAEGWVSVGGGNQDRFETRGYLAGAIKPGLLTGSVAFVHNETDGDLKDSGRDGKDSAVVKLNQIRGLLHYTPTERFDATLSVDGMAYDEDYVLAPDPRYVDGARPRRTHTTFYETPHYDGGGVSLKLNYRLDEALTLRSISAYRGYTTPMATDWGTAPDEVLVYGFGQTLRQRQASQEFQLSGDYDRFSFTTGVMLYGESFKVDRLTWTNQTYTTLHSDSDTRTAGLYGQASYRLTDKLRATAGLRLNHETKEMDSGSYRSNAQAEDLDPVYQVEGLKKSYSGFTPKITLDYAFSPTLLSYATWARGQTSGGFNPASASLNTAVNPVDQEKVTSYEIGLKDTSWNGRLRTNVAVFYNDYENYQASVTNPVINGQTVPGGIVVNAGDAHTAGIELDSLLRLTSQLDFSLSLAYLDTEFDKFLNPSGAAASDLTGQELPKAPEFTAAGRLLYTQPLATAGVLRFSGAVRYEEASYSDISTAREITRYPSQTYVDLGLSHSYQAWTTSLTVKNAFDKTYELPGLYAPARDIYTVTYNPSRTFFLSVRRDLF